MQVYIEDSPIGDGSEAGPDAEDYESKSIGDEADDEHEGECYKGSPLCPG